MARQHSPEAIAARHAFRASYWNWRSFRAKQLPSLTLTSDPSLNRSIQSVTLEDGSDKFVHRNQLSVDAGLEIQQNIALTGGTVLLKTGLQRLDMFTDNVSSYKSTPVVIGYEQNLFGYNDLKWERRIEPIKFEEAKKAYIETLELVAAYTTNRFFNLASAQTSLEIAEYNFAYADTLYRYAQGRYNIGTITENEMLQLELNKLTEQTNRLNAQIDVDDYIQSLRSYLGISENITLAVIPDDSIPRFTVNVEEAMQLAFQNNPRFRTPPPGKRKLRCRSKSQPGIQSRTIRPVRFDTEQRETERVLPQPDGPTVSDARHPYSDPGLGRRKRTGQGGQKQP